MYGGVNMSISLTFPPKIAMGLALLVVYNLGIILMATRNKASPATQL